MEMGSLILVLLVAAVGIAIVALPFLRSRSASATESAVERQDLVNDYARVVAALRDLEEDHTTGKIADDAYEVEKGRLTEQGVALLQALDKEGLLPTVQSAGGTPPPAAGGAVGADEALDEALEAAIARYASAKAKG